MIKIEKVDEDKETGSEIIYWATHFPVRFFVAICHARLSGLRQLLTCFLRNFKGLFWSSSFFFSNLIFSKHIMECHQGVKQFGSRSGPTFVGPDLDQNCMQR